MSDRQGGQASIGGVAFDLDGLLVNTEELYQHVGSELLARRGRLFEADLLDRMMGRPQAVSLQIMIEWHRLDDTIEVLKIKDVTPVPHNGCRPKKARRV
jgi:beta-phosphoglucomutase-like phosphatase (HAD superfamily)